MLQSISCTLLFSRCCLPILCCSECCYPLPVLFFVNRCCWLLLYFVGRRCCFPILCCSVDVALYLLYFEVSRWCFSILCSSVDAAILYFVGFWIDEAFPYFDQLVSWCCYLLQYLSVEVATHQQLQASQCTILYTTKMWQNIMCMSEFNAETEIGLHISNGCNTASLGENCHIV